MNLPGDITRDEERAVQLLIIALDMLGVPEDVRRTELLGSLLHLGRVARGVV